MVKAITWIPSEPTAIVHEGRIGDQFIADIFEYDHGTYESPEKRFQLLQFGCDDLETWHTTLDEAKTFCQTALESFVKSITEE